MAIRTNVLMQGITGATRLLGIIGCPVSHSRSPVMQNTALHVSGLDYVYVPFLVHPESLETAISGLRALGVSGFNVTIPHKESIVPYLDRLDESARIAGAVNTVRNDNGTLIGFNTDGEGFVKSLSDDLGYTPGSEPIVMLGAGGAARGTLTALCRHGAENIVIINRTAASAISLAESLASIFPHVNFVSGNLNSVNDYLHNASLLVNSTSVGMHDDMFGNLDIALLPDHAKVYDMVYAPAITPLLRASLDRGLLAANGLGMLSAQGELAFHIWTGMFPPQGLMKSVLLGI